MVAPDTHSYSRDISRHGLVSGEGRASSPPVRSRTGGWARHTPSKAGIFTFTLRVHEMVDGTSAIREFTITIFPEHGFLIPEVPVTG